MVVADMSTPSLRSSPLIRRYPQRGFSRPSRRTSALIPGSSGGRPGRRVGRRRPERSWRCQRVRVSGATRKLDHRSRPTRRLAAASSARSAVVKRGRAPPRLRTFS